jgi:type II secretory pathway component GspD/PulD (secretin)
MPGSWESGSHSISLTPNQQLLVNHTGEAHREVRHFLGKLRQYAGSMVSIETRFIAAHDNFLEDVGLDIRGLQDVGGAINPTNGAQISTSSSLTTPPTVVDFNDRTGQNEPGYIFNHGNAGENYDLRFRSIGSFLTDLGPGGTLVNEGGVPGYILGNRLADRGGLGIQYAFLGQQELNFVLRAVRKTEKAVIVSAPRVTVFNTQRSNIFIATQRAYIQDFDVEVTTAAFALDPIIGYVQDGIVLDVRPIISNDRRYVTMELRTTFADFQGFRVVLIDPPINAVLQLPFLVLEKAETTVRIPDRGTLLISGFRDILSRDLMSTVPFLGDIPIINFFFSRKAKGIEKRKLLILVSAEIIDLGEHLKQQKEPPQ